MCLIKSSKNSDEVFFPIDSEFEKKFSSISGFDFFKPAAIEEESKFPNQVCISCVSELEDHFNYK